MFEISILKATRTGTVRVLALGLLALVIALVGLLLAPVPAHAVTFTVNSTADPGTDSNTSELSRALILN